MDEKMPHASSGGTPKKRRGRPPSEGKEPNWKFERILLVIEEFGKLRASGMKRSSAIAETVEVIRKQRPELNISATEVKRIMAKHRSSKSQHGLFVTRKPQQQVNEEFANLPPEIKEFLGGKPPVNVVSFGFAPVSKQRSNARSQD